MTGLPRCPVPPEESDLRPTGVLIPHPRFKRSGMIVSTRFDAEMTKSMHRMARERGVTLCDLITMAIQAMIDGEAPATIPFGGEAPRVALDRRVWSHDP